MIFYKKELFAIQYCCRAWFIEWETKEQKPCDSNGVLPHLQMVITEMWFAKDFRYGTSNF